nr:MAG TPA: hypothetical protein [Crassvirales sp.]
MRLLYVIIKLKIMTLEHPRRRNSLSLSSNY